MAGVIRRATIFAINRAQYGNFPMHLRSIFTSSGIGVDSFKISREQHAARFAPSLDSFKKRFIESVGKPNAEIFTEDLRNMIMSANNEQEIDTVIEALKKYSKNKMKFSDYHFGSPVMRLLYIQNKTDLALKLYLDDSLKDIFNDSASALVLLNKLIEEKRYDDVIKVFEHGSTRGFTTVSGRSFPIDVVMLTMESLFRQNTKESLVKAKELVSKVKERGGDLNPRAAAMIGLLAIQQGDISFALEISTAIRAQTLPTVQNIRAICYAEMSRLEEAINVVHLLSERKSFKNDRRQIFPLTMRHIRLAVEKVKDENLTKTFDELSKNVLKNNSLSTTDLPEFLMEPINRRPPVRQNREGNLPRRNFGNQGYRTGFNQSSGGFNRDNRFGNNNFRRDDLGYQQRSQNSYVDGYKRNYDNDRFSTRNQNASFNEFNRQDGRNQQQNQTFTRFSRTDSGSSTARRTGNFSSATFENLGESTKSDDESNTTKTKRTFRQ